MNWNEIFWFGTKQLSNLTENDAEILLKLCIDQGLINFDTSHSFGGGKIEKIMGNIMPNYVKIITKIPPKEKPPDKEISSIKDSYPIDWMSRSFESSLIRLQRDSVFALLIENWKYGTNEDFSAILFFLSDMKEKRLAEKIGISVPVGFDKNLPLELLKEIDIIQAPYNYENMWIVDQLDLLSKFNVEAMFYNIFYEGLLRTIKNDDFNPYPVMERVFIKRKPMIIGSSNENHIKQNVNFFKMKEY